MRWALVDKNGFVEMYGDAPDDSIKKQPKQRDGEIIDASDLDIVVGRTFITNGASDIVEESPGSEYSLDRKTRKWVINKDLAITKSLSIRKALLDDCDWTQLPDVPLATKEAWATYRQALRDITDQPGYPLNIVWPEPPAG